MGVPLWAGGCAAEPLPAAETGEAEQGQRRRPRPVDETGSCRWRSAPVFASARCGTKQRSAKRKRNAVCFLQAGSVPHSKNRAPQPGWEYKSHRRSDKLSGSKSAVRAGGHRKVFGLEETPPDHLRQEGKIKNPRPQKRNEEFLISGSRKLCIAPGRRHSCA